MESSSGGGSTATGGSSGNSFLPWHLIPSFKPGETEINEYTRRLEFLAKIWPPEHLPQLAPRACMLCEGTAFAKVVRLDPEKLRVSTTDGVKLVVKTLGGVWGQSRLEKKYERFERAIFGTIQKSDETHASYLARHEVQYEDLISMGATLEEMRAYILLRNSGLSADDKKKVIMDANGELEYTKVTAALQLLGSKFFGEVQQGSSKNQTRTKTYDANMIDEQEHDVDDGDENVFLASEVSEETAVDIMMAEGDEDALVVQQFEDAILESLQSDPEIASCLNAYVDARKRLLDKAKGRGFWGPSKTNKGKGKGKFKGGFRSQFRKPLAQRILESSCKICHQKGHWKAECPQRFKAGSNAAAPATGAPTAFAGVSLATDGDPIEPDGDLVSELPENAVAFTVEEVRNRSSPLLNRPGICFPPVKIRNSWNQDQVQSQIMKIRPDLVTRLRAIVRPNKMIQPQRGSTSPRPDPLGPKTDEDFPESSFFVSHGSTGIVDLGASMSVIGQRQFSELCQSLPAEIRGLLKEAPCNVSFRFGNNSMVTGKKAVFFPIGPFWMKVIVVPSNTPFLIANSVFRSLGAVIDTESSQIFFKKLGRSIPIVLNERKLYRLDMMDLLTAPISGTKGFCQTQATMSEDTKATAFQTVENASPNQENNTNADARPRTVRFADETAEPFFKAEQSRLKDQNTQFQIAQHEPVGFESHVDRRTVRSAGRSPSPSSTGQSSQLGGRRASDGNELGRTPRVSDRVWKSPHEQALQGDGEGRSLPDMVRRDLPPQPEDLPHEVPPLHRAALGRCGKSEEPNSTQVSSQSQGQAKGLQSCRTSCPGSPRVASRPMAPQLRRGDRECVVGASGPCRRDQPHERAHDRDGVRAAADPEPSESTCTASLHGLMTKHQVADLCGVWQTLAEPSQVFDPMSEVGVRESILLTREDNWVAREMWNFFSQKGVFKDPQRYAKNLSDVMEIYCSSDSELTKQAQQLGLHAERFCLQDGDLATMEGRQRPYERLLRSLPRNIWLSPKCRAWCRWNIFNMSKSPETAQRIFQAREDDRVHLLLCDAVFQFQMWRSPQCHVHLEQPQGSQMIYQEEMSAIVNHGWIAVCDMCRAGQLKHPISGKLLKKGTQIITTSQIMKQVSGALRCSRDHEHDSVEGSFHHPDFGRVNVSQYTELYTRVFARKVARCLQCIGQIRERHATDQEDALTSHEPDSFETPEPKRQKILGKQNPPLFYQRQEYEQKRNNLLQLTLEQAPKVGKCVFREGPVLEQAQSLFPDIQVKAIEACKGADRYRPPCDGITRQNATHRMTMGIHRNQDGNFSDEAWENWTKLSRKDIHRKGPPARLLVTLFGMPRADHRPDSMKLTGETQSLSSSPRLELSEEPVAKKTLP